VLAAVASTVNRYVATIRNMLRTARDEWQWVDSVPKSRLAALIRFALGNLTPQEFAKFGESARKGIVTRGL
jgi:hypothetical protein